MRPVELQRDSAAATSMLRQAMDPERLRRVLRMAGADEVIGDAPQALREAAADTLGRNLGRPLPNKGRPPADVDANTLEEARACTKRAYVEVAVHLAGLSSGAEAAQQALVFEIVALARHAVRFARSEGRAVDHHCIAVAASRRAEDLAAHLLAAP